MRRSTLALSAAVLVAALGLAAMALAPMWRGGGDPFAPCRGGRVAGGDIGGPFTLVDGQGVEVTDAEVFARPAILYFGYTFCPDVCPLDMMRNGEATRLLAERGLDVTPVFVSVDPERDTPEVAGAFALTFADDAVGLSGSRDQVEAAMRAWRVYGRAPAAEPGDGSYLVDHSTFSYLVLPGTGFVDVVGRDEPAEAVADRMQCFLDLAARA